MKRAIYFTFASLLLCTSSAYARDAVGQWGIGGFFSYHMPLTTLSDWYGNTPKYGGSISYVVSPRLTTEVEFHRSVFSNSALPDKTFDYRGRQIVSPAADSKMRFLSLSSNWLWYFKSSEGRELAGGQRSPYLMLGVGFYDYKQEVSGLIYPGNSRIPNGLNQQGYDSSLDVTLVYPGAPGTGDASQYTTDELKGLGTVTGNSVLLYGLVPTTDTRTAWTMVSGIGVENSLSESVALDVRGRLNVSFGDYTPFLAWGLDRPFPIITFDVGVNLKFYFE